MQTVKAARKAVCFNSRTHVGVRPFPVAFKNLSTSFQFTHPRGGATQEGVYGEVSAYVSIHAPTWGCDDILSPFLSLRQCFNSRIHVGVRPSCSNSPKCEKKFQFTHPRGGATAKTDKIYLIFYLFLLHFSYILSYYPISLPYFLSHHTWFPGANRPDISCLLLIRTGPVLYL